MSVSSEFLGEMATTALGALGRTGQLSAAFSAGLNFIRGNLGKAVYSIADYYVYSALAEAGAAGAVETGGESAAIAAAAGGAYYLAGGSGGIVQSTLCTQ